MCRRLGLGFGECIKEGTTLKTLKSTIFHFNTNILRFVVIKLSQVQPKKGEGKREQSCRYIKCDL